MGKNDIIYRPTTLEKQINIDKMYTIFCNEMSNNYSSLGESHEFWEIIYVMEGNLLVDSDNNYFELEQGYFFLHSPNEYHRHFVIDAKAFIYITSFDSKDEILYQIARKKIKANSFAHLLTLKNIKFADEIFGEITNEIIGDKESFLFVKRDNYNKLYEQILRNSIESILISLLIQEQEVDAIQIPISSITTSPEKEKSIGTIIIEYMKEHIYESIRIEELCKIVHLSKTTLSTKFKAETGKSIIEYYNNLKCLKATELLERTNMNISEISEALNFSTSQYFSRVFKKYIGVFPSHYKKHLKNSKIIVSK